MRRASILALAVLSAGAVLLPAAAASAQAAPANGQAAGLRYMTWAGKPDAAAITAPATRASADDGGLRRPNLVIPHGGFAEATPRRAADAAPPPAARGLTPATAWMRPAAPVPAPPPPPPAPVEAAAPVMAAAPPPAPDFLPDQGGRGQPAPAEAVYSAPVEPAAAPVFDPADPMAPRRDAPVFRMQRPQADAPAPNPGPARAEAAPSADAPRETLRETPRRVATVTSNPADHPAQQGARYYSVHRQVGLQPDPVIQPQPTYIDALAVNLPETPASQDLAQPAEPPTLIRDSQGRLRAAPAAPDGDYQ